MKLGETVSMNVEHIPTGSIALDVALGIGGIPRGRIIEIFGPESSGKTTLALHCIAEAQKLGGEASSFTAGASEMSASSTSSWSGLSHVCS